MSRVRGDNTVCAGNIIKRSRLVVAGRKKRRYPSFSHRRLVEHPSGEGMILQKVGDSQLSRGLDHKEAIQAGFVFSPLRFQ